MDADAFRMRVDELWFSELRGVEPSEPFLPANFDDRKIIRAHWDGVEQNMRAYLASLFDALAAPLHLRERP